MTFLPSRFAIALAGVGAIFAFAPTANAQPVPPSDTIKQKTEEVFKRPEFQPTSSSSNSWLFRQIVAFFKWLGSLHEAAPVLFWLILISCLALLVGMIVLIVLQIRSAFVIGEKTRRESAAHAKRVWLSANYRAESDRRAEGGDYTEAIRFLFLALVYRFDERGRVSLHKEYTNREYLDLMSSRRNVRGDLQLLVDILDDHWYGQRPCQRQQYEACLAVYERLAA